MQQLLMPALSVVVPVYRNAGSIPQLRKTCGSPLPIMSEQTRI